MISHRKVRKCKLQLEASFCTHRGCQHRQKAMRISQLLISLVNYPSINYRRTVTPETIGVNMRHESREVKNSPIKLGLCGVASLFRNVRERWVMRKRWKPHVSQRGWRATGRGGVGTQPHIWTAALS